MISTFLVCRYVVFALFVAYSSIIASVAAWNLGYARGIVAISQVDLFLTVVGILETLFIFPMICVDIARHGAHSSRVSFEIGWVGLFWIFQLCGAAATTALTPNGLCGVNIAGVVVAPAACTSAQVLVAFTWISMMTHMSYLLALIFMAIAHSKRSPEVWRSGVRDFPWFSGGVGLRRLESATSSDMESYKAFPTSVPRHGRPRAMTQVEDSIYVSRPYQTAPYIHTEVPHPPQARLAHHAFRPVQQQEPSFYNQALGLHLGERRETPAPPPSIFQHQTPPAPVFQHQASPPSIVQPQAPPPTPPVSIPVGRPRANSTPLEGGRVRPRGPRHRPPPLDLSRVSNIR
jgi:hypothetical protein